MVVALLLKESEYGKRREGRKGFGFDLEVLIFILICYMSIVFDSLLSIRVLYILFLFVIFRK